MSIKHSGLKNILTTASIAAVILGYSESIFAVGQSRTVTGAASFKAGAGLDQNATGKNVTFSTGSTLKFTAGGIAVTANKARTILAVDINGQAGTSFNINQDTIQGSTVDNGGVQVTSEVIAAGKKLTLSGTSSDGSLAAPDPANSGANQFVAAVNTYTAFGDVDFVGAGAILEVNNSGLAVGPDAAEAGKAITLTGAFLNPANGTLNVITPLIVTDASVAEIAVINVGAAGAASSFTIDGGIAAAAGNAIELLDGVNLIALKNAGSILKLTNSDAGAAVATFNLKKNFDPSGGAGAGAAAGIVELNANTGTGQLFLAGDAGGETLGTAANPLAELRITGDEVAGVKGVGGGANEVDLTHVELLNVHNSAGFYAETATVAAIPKINIGRANTAAGGAPDNSIDGVFIIDSVNANLLATAGDEIKFLTADSVLKIVNTAVGGGTTVTLEDTLPVAVDQKGIVKLQAGDNAGGGGNLTIGDKVAGGSKLGTSEILRLKELELSGNKDIDVNVEIFAKKITLDGTGGAEFTKVVNAGAGSEMKFNAAKPIKFDEDATIETTDFNNRAGTIEIAAGKKLKTKLDSTGGIKGKVKFAGAGELIGGAAAGAFGIEEVMVDGNVGDILKVSGKHKMTELTATKASTIEFADGAELDGGINIAHGAAVKLDFKKNNRVTNGIGRVGNPVGDIMLAGVNNRFKGDIYTSKIIANGAEFVVEDNTTVHGDFEGAGTTMKLGEKILTLENTVLTGAVTFAVKTQAGGADIGHVVVDGAGKNLDLTRATGITINMDTAALIDVNTKTYRLLRINAGGAIAALPAVAINVADRNAAIGWTFDPATSTLTPKDNAAAAAGGAMGGDPQAKEIGDSLANRELGSPADKVVQGIARLPFELREDAIKDELPIVTTGENIAAVNSAVADVITSAVSGNVATISARMGNIASPVGSSFGAPSFDGGGVVSPDNVGAISSPDTGGGVSTDGTTTNRNNNRGEQQQTEAYGVAAGDEIGVKMGLWASPFYSSSTQKLRGETPGYKAASTGGTVGFDGMITDTSILGAAFTYVDTTIKHRNEKVGDKTKAETYMGSIYGVQGLANNFFAQGILSYSHNKIKNNEFRSLTSETARGKYNSDSYGGEVMFGKNLNVSGAAITPMLGVRYTKFYDKGYTETGASINNLTVKKKNSEKCEGILGARLTGINYINETTLLPEIHGFVNHDFIGKKPKVDARFDGSKGPLATRAIKPTKTFYNAGVGVTAKHRNMEYSIGYDAHLAKKYVGHQGSMKIRVNL